MCIIHSISTLRHTENLGGHALPLLQVAGQHRNDAMCLWIILLVQRKEVASASSLAGWPSCFLSLIFKFNVICLCEQLLTTLKLLSGGGHASVGAGSTFNTTVVPLFSHVYFLGCESSVLGNTSVFCLTVQSISSSLSLITSSHCLILCRPQMCFSFLGTQCYSNRQRVLPILCINYQHSMLL